MSIHYYSGWFDESLPASYLESLRNDITDKKSLVLIWGCWSGDELIDFVKNDWLKPGGIVFDEYHLVDNRKTKEEGRRLIKEASALLLLGGDVVAQSEFFKEYELAAPIKDTSASVIMSFSAGAINMASKGINGKALGDKIGATVIYDGLGLDSICYVPYFSLDKYESAKNDLLPLSQEIDIYATSPESFIRKKCNDITAFGDVHLISGSKIEKMRSAI